MATAGDQIKRALRLLGVLAGGEEPSANDYADAVVAFNQLIASWNTERLSVFATTTQTFTWPSGQASRTLGPSGDFNGDRPVLVDPATYFVVNGISYPLALINQEQYNAITLKTSNSPLPEVLFVNATYPDVTMYLYPVPSTALTFNIVSVSPLEQVADETVTIDAPDEYLRALAYNLAVELAPEYGVEPSRTVMNIARASKRNIKRINNPDDVLSMPGMLLGTPRYNIFAGNY